jgi:superfamily II DNA/RNA helicase
MGLLPGHAGMAPWGGFGRPAVQKIQNMSFEPLGLSPVLTRAVQQAGYESPTEVQSRAIPPALLGLDLMVSSSTGSGKTASFMLPALQRVLAARGGAAEARGAQARARACWCWCPTRELAMQVAKAAVTYGRYVPGLRVATIVGGVPYGAQLLALRGPLDILIATPGRLIDHLGSGKAVLGNIEMLVLDEADRMLDMGFIDDIHHIAASHAGTAPDGDVQRHLRRARRPPGAGPAARPAAHRCRLAYRTHADIEQRLHWADDLATRTRCWTTS